MNRVKAFFAGFIPKHISSRAVLGFMNLFSFRIPKRLRERHLKDNSEKWISTRQLAEKDGLLEKQDAMTDISLGNRSADVNACEVMAVYNALKDMGEEKPFPELAEWFEKKGLCLFGAFGTAPGKIKKFFKESGFKFKVLTGKALSDDSIDELAEEFKTFIVTVYNDRENIMAMIHTMCITWNKGGYVIHNSSSGGRVFASLSELLAGLNGGRSKTMWLLGVACPQQDGRGGD